MLINLVHNQIRRQFLRFGFKERFLESGRFSLHFYEKVVPGSERTLVLLHGLGTSSSTWVRMVSRVDASWNVIALDLPGFGFSRILHGDSFASIKELGDAVTVFFASNLTHPVVLVGHSLGGWLAAAYALEHPASVRHLVLVDNAGILCDDTGEQGKAFQVETVADLRSLLNKIWMRYPWYFRPFYPAILKDMKKRRVAEFVRSVQESDFLNTRLDTLDTGVSIVWGKQDRLIGAHTVEIMKQILPHADVMFIDRCGHVPQLEQPKKFAAVLNDILVGVASDSVVPRETEIG